jgi:hypothetical protein
MELFMSLNKELSKQTSKSDRWHKSPFLWIRGLTPKRKGTIGEKLAFGICEANGIKVAPRTGVGHDMHINGKKVEVKFASLADKGVFIFNQIRNDDYDYLFLLGIDINSCYLWVIPKRQVLDSKGKPIRKEVVNQHKGKAGSDTFFINSLDPNSPYPWLKSFGGSIEKGVSQAKKI